MNYKIKILKDTPWDVAGTELTISDFRLKYGYICTRDIPDSELIGYIKQWNSHPILSQTSKYCISDWFKVVEYAKFKVGDWVWHEKLARAFVIMPHTTDSKKFWPNYCTLEAVKENPDIYKRTATKEQRDYYSLYSFGDILIGRSECYYYNNIWKPLTNVSNTIATYISKNTNMKARKIGVVKNTGSLNLEHEYDISLNGIKVGCKIITHGEVIEMAKYLKLI